MYMYLQLHKHVHVHTAQVIALRTSILHMRIYIQKPGST